MSEGVFGWLIGGSLGAPTHESPGALEQQRQWAERRKGMGQIDPKSPAALELARGMAAVNREEFQRRMLEVAPGMANAYRPATPPAETASTPPTSPPPPKDENL